jgi:uncharacterized caspase-like protein
MPSSVSKQRLHVLSIGVNRYKEENVPDLLWATNDARAVHAFFKRSIAASAICSRLLTNERATLSAIKHNAGEWIAQNANEIDTVIIYFAGHGAPEISSGSSQDVEHFLVPHDARRDRLYSTAFSLERDLPDMLARIRSENVVIILDCCFSGAGGGRGIEGHHLRIARLHRLGNARSAIVTASGVSVDLGRGRVMLLACGASEQATESSVLKHGVFTDAILRRLESNSKSKRLAVALLHDSVVRAVASYTSGAQTPTLKGVLQNQYIVTGG